MTYINVKEENDDRLHLVREPSVRAWAVVVGLVSLGLGAAYYSADYLLWKIAYVSGAVFLGLTCMEDWEECVIDKKEGKISIKKVSLIQKFFTDPKTHQVVTAEVDEVVAVSVEEESIKYGGSGHQVVLHFLPGYSLGVTETASVDDKSEHEYIAEKIKKFLDIKDSPDEVAAEVKESSDIMKETPEQESSTSSTPPKESEKTEEQPAPEADKVTAAQESQPQTPEIETSAIVTEVQNQTVPPSDSSSDEDFEHIDKAELVQEGAPGGASKQAS